VATRRHHVDHAVVGTRTGPFRCRAPVGPASFRRRSSRDQSRPVAYRSLAAPSSPPPSCRYVAEPRHTVIVVQVSPNLTATKAPCSPNSSTPAVAIAHAPTTHLDTVAVQLSHQLGANQLLRLTHDRIDGISLSLPWATDQASPADHLTANNAT
jgi:hypothetical protein